MTKPKRNTYSLAKQVVTFNEKNQSPVQVLYIGDKFDFPMVITVNPNLFTYESIIENPQSLNIVSPSVIKELFPNHYEILHFLQKMVLDNRINKEG